MLTVPNVARCFVMLAKSVRPPFDATDAEQLETAAAALVDVLPELDDRQLEEATRLHLRSGDRWWPTPGRLLELVSAPREEDDADGAWGEVRRLRRVHGAHAPLPPGPDPLTLSTDEQEARVRWRMLEALGGRRRDAQLGWQALVAAVRSGDDMHARAVLADAHAALVADVQARLERAAAPRAGSVKLKHIRLPGSTRTVSRSAAWLQGADAEHSVRALCIAASRHGDRPVADPYAPKPWRLSSDPLREAAMHAGLSAVGGWTSVWAEGATELERSPDLLPAVAADRASFRSAYRGVMNAGRQLEQHGHERALGLRSAERGLLDVSPEEVSDVLVSLAERRQAVGR